MTEQTPPRVPEQGYAPPAQPYPGHPPPPPRHPGYGLPPGYQPTPLSPGGQPLASFSDRLLAYLVDAAVAVGVSLVLVIPAVIVLVMLVVDSASHGSPDEWAFILWFLLIEGALILVVLAFSYLYHVEWLIRHDGQTFGKKVMKLRIVPLEPTTRLTRGVAARRWLVTQGCGLLPGVSYLDGLWQLWDKPYQQCLHDKWPKTVVIKVPA
ncbi:RDD family protein [Rhizomonospora bruguierae]|uniref:RDD family protein n=1 Tax=Rhizomonospora bruguierae TaxID=1581705 RepID=UPI001BCD5533|nr:RDD family protein [Micromonospora sp. NBRC 107566]